MSRFSRSRRGRAVAKLLPTGRVALGSAIYETPVTGAVWALGRAGFDWLWLDTEHSPNDEATVARVAEASAHCGIPLLVRVRDLRAAPLSRPLDFGARGIIVPRVESAEEALRVVRACHYPPHGVRGIGLQRRYCPNPALPAPRQLPAIRARTVVIVQVETAPALACVEEIAAVPGLDGILVGPADLSISLGHAGRTDHLAVLKAMRRVAAACAANGVSAGYHHDDAAEVCRAARFGFDLLSVGFDTGHLFRGAGEAARRVRGAASGRR
jgi:2-keto-3-deoxy-L-rhamnonate aldolase RhmA